MTTSAVQQVLVVDFNHARGPEIEFHYPELLPEARPEAWNILPFQALPDGSHLHDEDFSYFTVITGDPENPTSFGISCTRQLKSSQLQVKDSEVTRSTIQKAVVVLTRTPHIFAHIKDKLTAVTQAYFSQLNFGDREILVQFYDALVTRVGHITDDSSLYTGMPVRSLIHNFRYRVLILLKALLLEKKVLYFGTNVEKLCTAQYCVLSLVPGLLENLKYCGDPRMAAPEGQAKRQESLKTSDKRSVMRYMGMPLQPFNIGRFFGPYTPLQQVELLEATPSYMIGTSNSLFLHSKEKHCDVLVNVDTNTIEILNPDLRSAFNLSTADRKWIDAIVATVEESWDPDNPDIPITKSFLGSEENVRNLFENYLYSMCSVVRYDQYLLRKARSGRPPSPEHFLDIEHDLQMVDYGPSFLLHWKRTENFKMWDASCDLECFDVFEPKHPVLERSLTVADVQARLTVVVQDLKLDERTAQTRAAIGRTWASGTFKLNKLISEATQNVESLRDSGQEKSSTEENVGTKSYLTGFKDRWIRSFGASAEAGNEAEKPSGAAEVKMQTVPESVPKET